ncbi:MAG: hypothetical protein FWD77_08125 [Betaproteobacteria bacterium]|nr:hypothetical protein [Betaproteobacteria bacterium]
MKAPAFKRALGGATLILGASLALPAWADATFNASDSSLSISTLNIAGMGFFCDVRVHLDGSGQWSLLAGNECPSQASPSGSYNLGTGALSLPHINIPGLGEFVNVSARLDANTWRWQLLGAEPAGGGNGGNTGSGSIAACFSWDKPVSFAIAGGEVIRRTVGPATYKGRAVMGQSDFYQNASQNSTEYYEIRDGSIFQTDRVYTTGNTLLSCSGNCQVMPLSAQPGYSFDSSYSLNEIGPYQLHTTFVGTETLTLAGKVFSNVCHLNQQATLAGHYINQDLWYAPGYGLIKSTASSPGGYIPSSQYNGDL